ncbi:tRNA-uridine aminocarboxypropyltransferase [Oceaniserpentilla sp. 4NH20-0058]|uniref:tRNA-uridine aminocarboxypropyltransferase n=1 Tax=Oceaniserpentilla sp. 4NH20-0058 TaxID=3127660 RepID=UPI00333FB5EC
MSLIYCYRCTLPMQDCVCQQAPSIQLPKPCSLLFHPREYSKHSNTGRLVKIATNVQSETWHRLKNHQQSAQFEGFALLYPHEPEFLSDTTNKTPLKDQHDIKGYLLIDATWQESRKMLRQSPWLAQLPRISLNAPNSKYALRRNQSNLGLSTIETVSHLLFEHNQRNSAKELLNFLQIFQSAYLQAQQAGLLK